MSEQDMAPEEAPAVLAEIQGLREALARRYGAAEVDALIDPLLGTGPVELRRDRYRILHALQALRKIQTRVDKIDADRDLEGATDHDGRGGFAYNDPRAHAVAEMRSAFADFSRNGRWGTCERCPCDGYGRKLPELCARTESTDHQRDMDMLVVVFKHEVTSFARSQGPR